MTLGSWIFDNDVVVFISYKRISDIVKMIIDRKGKYRIGRIILVP